MNPRTKGSRTSRQQLIAFAFLCAIWGAFTAHADTSAPSSSSGTEDRSETDALSIPLGPLKFTAGPQDDGHVGASLKGGLTESVHTFIDGTDCIKTGVAKIIGGNSTTTPCDDVYLELNANVDGGWESGGATKNNIAGSFQPSFYWMHSEVKDATSQEKIAAQGFRDQCTAAVNNRGAKAVDAVMGSTPACTQMAIGPHHPELIAIAAYPDLEYRYGHFSVSGTDYSADQLIYGGGLRILYPAKIGGWFGNWPYVSAAYYGVNNYHLSNIPLPSGIQDHYLVLNERAEFYIKGFEDLTGSSALVLFDLTESLPTSGATKSGWQVARLFQLIIDTKGSTGLKPALTYRSGEDKGLTYDKQVIFGILWDFWNPGKKN